ncbi:MAG: hypothetical protein NXI16_14375 [Alphaproteobacteria bacterium]|nr:hypothetical protein [Alphaproteobacteria bacterium]
MAQVPTQNGQEVESNNSRDSANIVTSGAAVAGTLSALVDDTDSIDVFRLDVPHTGTLTLQLASSTNSNLVATIEDANGTEISTLIRAGSDINEDVTIPCTSAVYLSLRATAGNAEYSFTPTFEADPFPVLTATAATTDEADTLTTDVTFTASLSAAASCDVGFTYTPTTITATSGADFDATARTATIPAGQSSVSFTVPVNGDILIENDETFSVSLSSLSNAQFENGADTISTTATIVENDGFIWNGQAYLDANPDLGAAGVTVDQALLHYVNFGYSEGRRLAFDSEAYIQVNPDLIRAGLTTANALEHFLAFGQNENRPLDANDYLNANPDLVEAGITVTTAGEHFVNYGRTEGRVIAFDAPGYILANPDLTDAGLTVPQLIEHFQLFSESEGRGLFTPGGYIAANPDVASAGIDVYLHYQELGRDEGRLIVPPTISPGTFDGI